MGKLTYSTQEVQDRLDAVGTLVRPNLLNNWYFVGGGSQQGGGKFPINQRGQTSYSTTDYAIDRWRTWDATEDNVWIQLTSDGVRISRTFYQYKEPSFFEGIYGKTVTFSILFSDGELYSGSLQLTHNEWFTTWVNHGNISDLQIGISNADFSNMNNNFIRVRCINPGTLSSSITAVKFELGDTQTLAHQENGTWVLNEIPNYQQELEKCQRYQIELVPPGNSAIGCIGGGTPTSSTQCYVFVPTPTELRTVPTLTYAGTWKLVREGTAPSSGLSVSAMSVVNRSANGVTLQITSSGLSTSYRYDLWYTAADATNNLLLSANL